MKDYVIVTDSTSDLTQEYRDKYNIFYLPMRILFNDKDLEADIDFREVKYKEYFDLMRNGVRITTSQVPADVFRTNFEKWISEGKDVLYIACSSALSESYRASCKISKEIMEGNPDAKIICVDSRNACLGQGLICITASELKSEGKTIEETAKYIEEHKFEVNQYCTVEDLIYLKRAGRVSASSAFFGGLIGIKPIVVSNEIGINYACKKVRGRMSSIKEIVNMFVKRYIDNPHQKIIVAHADCDEDGQLLLDMVKEAMPDKSVEIMYCHIGPIIGASTGPGTLVIYAYGKTVEGETEF